MSGNSSEIVLKLIVDSKTGEIRLKNFGATAGKTVDGVKNKLSGLRGAFTKMSAFGTKFFFGLQGLRMLTQPLGNLIRLSNEQEKADANLSIAMKQVGQYSDANFKAMKKQASAIQGLTTSGDEQVQMLQSLALNMGVSFSKVDEATRGSIGLAQSFKKAGLSQELALKGIALAYQGNFTQLQRYIPALRTAGTNAQKMAILQKTMGDGFKQSEALAKTSAGQMEQYANIVGDMKEKIGDLLKKAILPLIAIGKPLITWLNDLSPAAINFSGVVLALTAVAWKVVPAIRGISTATKLLGVSIKGALGWIGLIVTAAILLYTAWSTNLGGFQEALRDAWVYLKEWAGMGWEVVKGYIESIVAGFGILAGVIRKVFKGDFSGAVDEVSNAGSKFVSIAQKHADNITAIRSKAESERAAIAKEFAAKEEKTVKAKVKKVVKTEKTLTARITGEHAARLISLKNMESMAVSAVKKANDKMLAAAVKKAQKLKAANDSLQDYLFDSGRMSVARYKNVLDDRLAAVKEKYGAESQAYLELSDKKQQIDDAAEQAKIDRLMNGAETIAGIAQSVGEFYADQRNRKARDELNNWKASFKLRKAELKDELDKGKITKKEYEKRLKKLTKDDQNRTAKIEEDRRKKTAIEKAAAAAQIMISTINTAMQVYKRGVAMLPPPWGLAFGAAMAAIVMGFGMAKAAQARSVAYAQGGQVDQPHLGLVGEAGPEIIAPRKTFINVVQGLISGGEIRPAAATPAVSPAEIGKAVKDALSGASWKVNIDSDGLAVALEMGNSNLSDLEY